MEQHQNMQAACITINLKALAERISITPPPPRKLSKRDAIEALRPALLKALASGHTSASLASILLQGGLKIGVRTLASWTAAPRAANKKKSARIQQASNGGERNSGEASHTLSEN